MPRLSRDWERRAQSRRAAELRLAQPDIADLSKQLEQLSVGSAYVSVPDHVRARKVYMYPV